MSNTAEWYKQRDRWRQKTKKYPMDGPDVYKTDQLTVEVCDNINDIITSTKGPYPPFSKKINLSDLASLVEEIWEEE